MPGVAVGTADFALVLPTRSGNVCRLGRMALDAIAVAEREFCRGRCGGRGGRGEGRGCGKQQAGDEEQ